MCILRIHQIILVLKTTDAPASFTHREMISQILRLLNSPERVGVPLSPPPHPTPQENPTFPPGISTW